MLAPPKLQTNNEMPKSFKLSENLDGSEKTGRLACHVRLWYVHVIGKTRSNVAKTDMKVGTNSG